MTALTVVSEGFGNEEVTTVYQYWVKIGLNFWEVLSVLMFRVGKPEKLFWVGTPENQFWVGTPGKQFSTIIFHKYFGKNENKWSASSEQKIVNRWENRNSKL